MAPKKNDRERTVNADQNPTFQFVHIDQPLRRRTAEVERKVRSHVTSRHHEERRSRRNLSQQDSKSINPNQESKSSSLDSRYIGYASSSGNGGEHLSPYTESSNKELIKQSGSDETDSADETQIPTSNEIDGYFPMTDTLTLANPSLRNPFDVEGWATISSDMHQVLQTCKFHSF